MEEIIIGGRKCRISDNGGGRAVFIGISGGEADFAAEVESLVKNSASGGFTLIFYEAEDWNRDFSPWAAPAVFGKEEFSGGGSETLSWLENECIPAITRGYGTAANFAAGYSLAGLFSLWALYAGNVLSGAASCSGSLWFPQWELFAESRHAPENSVVYLSLGNREEQTKNAVMSAVGGRTIRQYERICGDKNVSRHILVWNEGGHFKDAPKRTAEGIGWLLKAAQEV